MLLLLAETFVLHTVFSSREEKRVVRYLLFLIRLLALTTICGRKHRKGMIRENFVCSNRQERIRESEKITSVYFSCVDEIDCVSIFHRHMNQLVLPVDQWSFDAQSYPDTLSI